MMSWTYIVLLTLGMGCNANLRVAVSDFGANAPAEERELTERDELAVGDPAAATFTDEDYDAGEIAGPITISRMADETNITAYEIYWGSSATTKAIVVPFATLPKTDTDLIFTLPENAAIPAGATHFLVFARNGAGVEVQIASIAIKDRSVPGHRAAALTFIDVDSQLGELGGSIVIQKASDESDITHYALYWGHDAETKNSATPIATVSKSGSDLTYVLPDNTAIPAGATHFLVYSKNDVGEMTTPTALAFTDRELPTAVAAGVAFTDQDNDAGEVSGTVTITKAADETGITSYVLYWGHSSTAKSVLIPIAQFPKSGANQTYVLPNDTVVPMATSYLLVFTANAMGESLTPAAAVIVDKRPPQYAPLSLSFTDTDPDAGEVDGTVGLTAAIDESDLTHYVLYWGNDTATKHSSTPIATLAKTGGNLTQAVTGAIPAGATFFLACTKNDAGESVVCASVAIADLAFPVHGAGSLAFTDMDPQLGELSGSVTIQKASDESDVNEYVLYWGNNATTKNSTTPIATISKTGGNVTHGLAANTAIPAGATHFLVYSKNDAGEIGTPTVLAFVDRELPTAVAAGVAFTDTDPDAGEVSGTITITKAADESNITSYVLYWGNSSTAKSVLVPIATLPKTGANLSHVIASDTTVPMATTHLLVFTANAIGESVNPAAALIVDTRPPQLCASALSFTDTDADGGEINGNIGVTVAANEDDITHYVLYWGSDATTKNASTAIASLAKTGANLTQAVSGAIQSGATHFLVYAKNGAGESAVCASVAIDDRAVPIHAPGGLTFTDTDPQAGKLGGTLSIQKASDESDVSSYVLYWGNDAVTKNSATPIATIAKTGASLTYVVVADTAVTAGATHFLVYTQNASGEMASGASLAFVDRSVPSEAAGGLAFADTDTQRHELAGTVTITKAGDESNITHYVLYFGSDATTKHGGAAIATLGKTGANLTHVLSANTPLPSGATHLLVYTLNAMGEAASPVASAITDLAVPVHAATSLSFTDSDSNGGELQGALVISKSSDESDLTDYVVYWGSDASTKASATPIATLAKTGANVSHNFAANTIIPPSAAYFLVYTANAVGEMETPVALLITDLGVPVHAASSLAFTDSDLDGGQLTGTVAIGKASDESDVTDYVLYWASSSTAKSNPTPIATLPATGSNLDYVFAADTPVNAGATHLLVLTRNADGEMATGASVAITDRGVPVQAAASVAFTDTDLDGGQLQGAVTINKAINENDISHYVLYWGSSGTVKASATPIATIAKNGGAVTHVFAADTAIFSGATHLLVFTKNADGEMGSGTAVAIVDKGVPTHAAVSAAFTDGDLDGGEVSGVLSVTKAADESDLTHYVLYWGSSTTTKASATEIAAIAKTGANVGYTFPANTAIHSGATHVLVFTRNADGDMGAGISVPIGDKGLPTNTAAGVSFSDTDLDGGQLQGTVAITKAVNESDLTHYVLYWGSNATTKASVTPIATVAKTGANVSTAFDADTPIHAGATHLLVYTKNADGEMASGVSVAIVDKGVPVNPAAAVAFTDSDFDGGQLQGNVTITKAADESDLTHYVLYWGSNATTKASATPISTMPKTGANLTHTFAANTAIYSGATHLLVRTRNADGEMATGAALAITDRGVPANAAAGMTFTDTDTSFGQIAGPVSITKAADESDVTDYVLYWGSNATTKASATPISTIAKTGGNVTYTFPANTAMYAGSTHLLVYTKNADGEMGTGINMAYTDVGVCGGSGDSCYNSTGAKAAGFATTPSGKNLEYVTASGGFKVWKEVGGSRVLKPTGLDAWAKSLNPNGRGFSTTDFTAYTGIVGRACPYDVYIDDTNKFSSNNCLYYTLEASQTLNQNGTNGINGLGPWSTMKWYAGNIQVCSAKGMRLPTLYETSNGQTCASPCTGWPISDGSPAMGYTTGVPSAPTGATWTASTADTSTWYFYWNNATQGRREYNANSLGVRCVLP